MKNLDDCKQYAYPKVYLEQIVETQGKLFDYVIDNFPNADTEDFITNYMQSKTRSFIDRADAYVCNMDANDLFSYFCKVDSYELKNGKSLTGFMPNWIGQFYAHYQWQKNISSSELIKKLPLDFVKSAYHGLHDLDLELAVEKINV